MIASERQTYTRSCHLEAKKAVRRFYRSALSGFGFLLIFAAALGQSSGPSTDDPTAIGGGDPALGQRKELLSEAVSGVGLIRLDATVTDQTGKAVAGLQRTDFKLLDNGQSQRLIAFHASNGASDSGEDSLSVILLLDTLDLPSEVAAYERQQVVQFLRFNSGKLARPVTIYTLEDSGFFLTARSSTDGEALAADVTSDHKVEAYFLAPKAHSPLKAVIEPSFDSFPALTGLRALWTIGTAQVRRPGRKSLCWIGPGLGTRGTGAFAADGRGLLRHSTEGAPVGYSISGKKGDELKRDVFQKMCWFSLLLRQARITLDCFSVSEDKHATDDRSRVLTVVPSAQEASWMNLLRTSWHCRAVVESCLPPVA